MGLDISYFRGLTLVDEIPVSPTDEQYDEFYEKFDFFFTQDSLDLTEKDFPGRTAGLKPGGYKCTEAGGFRAGSYSGYNWWRRTLEKLRPSSDAFEELIYFSDCEGVIGPVVGKRLADDFANNKAVICALARCEGDMSSYWIEKYLEWEKAFQFAAQDGCVRFH